MSRAFQRTCPTCKARPGQDCRGVTEGETYHVARISPLAILAGIIELRQAFAWANSVRESEHEHMTAEEILARFRKERDVKKLVTVETMPEHLRESHRQARNWGVYPHNGAVRERMTRDEAYALVSSDPDGYTHVVTP